MESAWMAYRRLHSFKILTQLSCAKRCARAEEHSGEHTAMVPALVKLVH